MTLEWQGKIRSLRLWNENKLEMMHFSVAIDPYCDMEMQSTSCRIIRGQALSCIVWETDSA